MKQNNESPVERLGREITEAQKKSMENNASFMQDLERRIRLGNLRAEQVSLAREVTEAERRCADKQAQLNHLRAQVASLEGELHPTPPISTELVSVPEKRSPENVQGSEERGMVSEGLVDLFRRQQQVMAVLFETNLSQYQRNVQTQEERMHVCVHRTEELEEKARVVYEKDQRLLENQREITFLLEQETRAIEKLTDDCQILKVSIEKLALLVSTVYEAQQELEKLKLNLLKLNGDLESADKALERRAVLKEKIKILRVMEEPIQALNCKMLQMRDQLQRDAETLRVLINERLTKSDLESVERTICEVNEEFMQQLSVKRKENNEGVHRLSQRVDEIMNELHAVEARRVAGNGILAQVYNQHTHKQPDVMHFSPGPDRVSWSEVVRANSTGKPAQSLTLS